MHSRRSRIEPIAAKWPSNLETVVADFSEEYRGYVIYVQVFNTPDGMAEIWCRICNPSDDRLSFLTGDMTQLSGGPFDPTTAYDVGMYYGMGVIDGHLGKDAS